MTNTAPGLFMKTIDWDDPRFAPWDIRKLGELNEAQQDAFWDDDVCKQTKEIDDLDLSTEQLKDLCLKVPCRVELNHSNVCYGVEKSWPKRMFKKANFTALRPKEKKQIYADMERKAVLLYNKYVSEERLAKRRQNRTNRALAPFYEEFYRRNYFNRVKALGERDRSNDIIVEDSILLSDSEADNSIQTVVNTGSYRGNRSNSSARKDTYITDLNDNDNHFIVNDENIANNVEVESVKGANNTAQPFPINVDVVSWRNNVSYHVNESVRAIEVDISNDDDDDDDNDVLTIDDNFADIMSESIVTSSAESQRTNLLCFTPRIDSVDILTAETPDIGGRMLLRSTNFAYGDDDDDVDIEAADLDSMDFYSQNMEGIKTSTQQ